MTITAKFVKDTLETLDYTFDFAAETNRDGEDGDWLSAGETLLTKTITVPTGITLDSSSFANTNTAVVVWLSSGVNGTAYIIQCLCTTSGARTVKRSMEITLEVL